MLSTSPDGAVMNSDRTRTQQLLREAEGYLDLALGAANQPWGGTSSLDARRRLARRVQSTLDRLPAPVQTRSTVRYLRGQAFKVAEQFASAVEELSAAAARDSENIHVLLALAWCQKRCGRIHLAIESLEQALLADPSEAILYYNLACYWALSHNAKLAVDYLAQAFLLDGRYREMTDEESDFDPIRGTQEFLALTIVGV